MKLFEAHDRSLIEASFIRPLPILEDGEAPRWRFKYDNWKNDPYPDILLLGSYRHPRTGNNLVGGINLHYLNKNQVDELARALPQIMQGGSLYGRYQEGKRSIPDVFDNYYRTYNSAYIRGVRQDVMYPKYGFLKTAQNWLGKKIGGIFKSKAQREKEITPEYPDDLKSMRDQLEQVVTNLQQSPPEEADPNSPEMQAARDEYIKAQQDKSKSDLDIEREEDVPYNRASADFIERQPTTTVKQIRTPATTARPQSYTKPTVGADEIPITVDVEPKTTAQKIKTPAVITPTQPATTPQISPNMPDVEPITYEASDTSEADSQAEEDIPELTDIADMNISKDKENDKELSESIIFYSPIHKKYVVEKVMIPKAYAR